MDWTVTYMGSGVVSVKDVGVFSRHTTAYVDEQTAKALEDDDDWIVSGPGQSPVGKENDSGGKKEEGKKKRDDEDRDG